MAIVRDVAKNAFGRKIERLDHRFDNTLVGLAQDRKVYLFRAKSTLGCQALQFFHYHAHPEFDDLTAFHLQVAAAMSSSFRSSSMFRRHRNNKNNKSYKSSCAYNSTLE